jgi:hypothetical protein
MAWQMGRKVTDGNPGDDAVTYSLTVQLSIRGAGGCQSVELLAAEAACQLQSM